MKLKNRFREAGKLLFLYCLATELSYGSGMAGYSTSWKLETAVDERRLLETLRSHFHEVVQEGDTIRAWYRPSSLFFWDGRGQVEIRKEELNEGRALLHVRFHPGLIRFDLDQLLFLLVIGLSVFGLSRGVLNGPSVLAGAFILLTTLLIAPYLLALALLGQTFLILRSYSAPGAVALGIAWLVFMLLIHVLLRYNRMMLERRWKQALLRSGT